METTQSVLEAQQINEQNDWVVETRTNFLYFIHFTFDLYPKLTASAFSRGANENEFVPSKSQIVRMEKVPTLKFYTPFQMGNDWKEKKEKWAKSTHFIWNGKIKLKKSQMENECAVRRESPPMWREFNRYFSNKKKQQQRTHAHRLFSL